MTDETGPGSEEARSAGGSLWGTLLLIAVIALVTGGGVLGFVLLRERPYRYDLSTPEAAFASARLMIERNDAERLSDLIEAGNENERRLLRQTGVTLGHLQDLANAIREAMPEELARYRAELEEAAARGEPVTFLDRIASRRRGERERPPDQGGAEVFRGSPVRARINGVLQGLIADPYAWVEASEARLSFQEMDEDLVALLWDENPILPPLGVVMRRQDDGRWQIVLPLTAPGFREAAPRSEDEFLIWGSLVASLDNVLVELTEEVRAGRHATFESVADSTFEKIAIPAVMIMYAYGQAVEARESP
ncbi:MAG: hypothetical protein ACIARR_02460 [Phycisphaerales bacterium JB059]